MKNKQALFLAGVMAVVAVVVMLAAFGWMIERPGPTTPTGVPKVSVDLDGGVSVTNTFEVCGVTVVWDYLTQQVTVVNHNDEDVKVEYNDFRRFPGPWGEKLPGRGGRTTVEQANIVGRKIQIYVRDLGTGKMRCNSYVKVLLGQ